ncbi:MAG: S49 family peptidase [Chloroflexi bacterium]|nr:S49 family peptidase [Chloroflexota bacterium]
MVRRTLFSKLARYNQTAWAIMPERLAAMLDMAGRIRGDLTLPPEEFEAALARPGSRQQRGGEIARIPLYGTIEHRADILTLMFGGTGLDLFQSEFRAALQDPNVKGILLDIDSPGGVVAGTPEMAREIRAARGQKPILAIANAEAASAAYYLGAQADEFSVTPSGQVGSIGVVYVHTDISGMAEKQGVSFRIFRSSERKADVNQFEPLSEEAAADIQAKVDAYDAMFVADVAAGRGITAEKVRADYGQGRMLMAADALKTGMVDRIETIGEAAARLARGGVAARQAAQATTSPSPQTGPIELSAERIARAWQVAKWRIPALAGASTGEG